MCSSADIRELAGFMPFELGGKHYRYPTKSVLCNDCDSITTLPHQQAYNAASLEKARQFVEAKTRAMAGRPDLALHKV